MEMSAQVCQGMPRHCRDIARHGSKPCSLKGAASHQHSLQRARNGHWGTTQRGHRPARTHRDQGCCTQPHVVHNDAAAVASTLCSTAVLLDTLSASDCTKGWGIHQESRASVPTAPCPQSHGAATETPPGSSRAAPRQQQGPPLKVLLAAGPCHQQTQAPSTRRAAWHCHLRSWRTAGQGGTVQGDISEHGASCVCWEAKPGTASRQAASPWGTALCASPDPLQPPHLLAVGRGALLGQGLQAQRPGTSPKLAERPRERG